MSSRDQWQRRLGPLYGGAVALVHSTPWRWPSEVGAEPRSAAWVVALGAPVGLVAWGAARLFLAIGFPAPLAAIVGLAMLTAASAALVERGLADAVDRWSGQLRAGGVASVLVLVFATLVRAAAIVFVAPASWLGVFVATAVAGRWAAVFLQALGDPVAHDPEVRSLVAVPAPAWLTAAISAAVVAVLVGALGKVGVAALALAAIGVFALGLATQRRDGGLTPAVVGAAAALGELVVLLLATLR